MKTFTTLLAATILNISPAVATGYSTAFDAGYDYGSEVAGQQGWTIDDPTPNLSFFVDLNRNRAAAVGGYYDSPLGTSVMLSHSVGVPLAGASFTVNMAMIGSTEMFPGRDSVAWCFLNASGLELFTIGFEPAADRADLLNVEWSAGGQIPVATGWAVYYHAPYTIDLQFGEAVAADVPFTVTVTGTDSFTFSGFLQGMAEESLASIGARFVVRELTAGDNFMAFDNLAVSPSPGFDGDGDGYSLEMEAWFGTSDSSAASAPVPVMSRSNGAVSLTFPSVPGRAYLIDWSDDLGTWTTAVVTATAAATVWQEPADALAGRRYLRIRKP